MESLGEIKAEKEARYSKAIKNNGVFFAFSNQQFDEGKTPLPEGDKYCSMGMGGYLPKSKVKSWLVETNDIEVWFKAKMKDRKLREDHIAYELSNHEAFYTGDIETTLDALGSDYTKEEVQIIYRKNLKKQENYVRT